MQKRKKTSQADCCSKLEFLGIPWGQTSQLPTAVTWGWVTCPGGCSAARGHLIAAVIPTHLMPVGV